MRKKKNNGRFEVSEPRMINVERTREEEENIGAFVMPSPYPDICGMVNTTEEYKKGIELSQGSIDHQNANTQRMMYHNSLATVSHIYELYDVLDIPQSTKDRMVGGFSEAQIRNTKDVLQGEYSRSVFSLDINFVQHIPEMVMNALECLISNNIMTSSESEYIMQVVRTDVNELSQKMLLNFNQLDYIYPSRRLNVYESFPWSPKQSQDVIEAERIHSTLVNIFVDPITKVNYMYSIVYSILSHALAITDVVFDEHEQHRMLPIILGYIDGCGHFINYAESFIDVNRIFTSKSYNIQDSGEYKMMNHMARRLFSRIDDDDYNEF